MAMNFLYAVQALPLGDIELCYLVAKNSEPHKFLQKGKINNFIVAPANPVARILFELFSGGYLLKKHQIDIVYSYFGYAWFPRRWRQLSGSADSNLYFPEIDFWSGYRGIARLKRWLVDKYRIFGIKRASAVVFENAAMEQRGRSIYKLRHTRFIMPSICTENKKETYTALKDFAPELKRGLFLCGWHLNKNVMLIPAIAAEMKKRGRPLAFVITAPRDNSVLHEKFSDLTRQYGVEDCVMVTGPVDKEQLGSLYEQIDYVFLLSKLESFSNTILEAWYYKKPLLIADELWSRAICHDAAIYMDRDDVKDIADKLTCLMDSRDTGIKVVENGVDMLGNYPSTKQRIGQEIEYVKYIFQNA